MNKILIICSLFTLFFNPVFAENNDNIVQSTSVNKKYRYYTTEIILFRHKNPQGLTSEYWEPVLEAANEIIIQSPGKLNLSLAKYHHNSKKFISLDPRTFALRSSNFQLTTAAERIRNSGQYKLISHFGWTQAGYNKQQALPVKLVFPASWNIQASIKVTLMRYLHLDIDLSAIKEICRKVEQISAAPENPIKIEIQTNSQSAPPSDTKDNTSKTNEAMSASPKEEIVECQNEIIKFKQSRKMRSKELHYIDHPVYGLLVLMTPYPKISEQN